MPRVSRAVEHLHREGLVQLPQADVVRPSGQASSAAWASRTPGRCPFRRARSRPRQSRGSTPSGCRPLAARRTLVVHHHAGADAPSENWLALPAEITPPGMAGRIFADAFLAWCRRGCPRRASMVTSLVSSWPVALSATPARTVIGTISSLKLPASSAAAARLLAARRRIRPGARGRCCSAWPPSRRSAACSSRFPACSCPARCRPACGCWPRSARTRWTPTPPATIDVAFARDDALGGGGDGLQARRAEAVDGHARGTVTGQAGAQGDLARDVGAGGAFRAWRSP